MKNQQTTEQMVLELLETRPQTRTDDFILYGSILKRNGIDLKATSLYDFLSTAKKSKYPSFSAVARARRKIQEQRPELKDKATAEARRDEQYEYIKYSQTIIGETK